MWVERGMFHAVLKCNLFELAALSEVGQTLQLQRPEHGSHDC